MTVVATSLASISAILVIYIPKELVREVAREQSHVHAHRLPDRNVIQWTRSYSGALIGLAVITANLCDPGTGWLRSQTKGSDQLITLVSCPRRFGGRQWYFVCPVTHRRASVLWKPPGAKQFRSRRHGEGRSRIERNFCRSMIAGMPGRQRSRPG
jgi:hypothetical protein